MPKYLSRRHCLLFAGVILFFLSCTGLPNIFSSSVRDDEIPHSLQLLTLLQQESYAPTKVNLLRHNDKSELRTVDSRWNAGLDAFRAQQMRLAAEDFVGILSDHETLSPADHAAAAFWAYRAFSSLGDKASAAIYLDMAAKEKPGFYSIIARHISGKNDLVVDGDSHKGLLTSLYPTPNWTPSSGYKVEPALLFAIMRQESEFDPAAQSAKGAMGVMQLMPDTARAMAQNIKLSGSIAEPSVSMALGQQYLKNLMDYPNIHNNMLFLLTAYNAGPTMLEKWQEKNAYNNDSLLFVESIPYSATRDYVVNVMGNYWVYAALFGDDDRSSVTMVSQGSWPLYSGSTKQAVTTAKN